MGSVRYSKQQIMSVGRHISTHADLRPHTAQFHERRISSVTFMLLHLYGNVYMRAGVAQHTRRFVRFWASGGPKFTKMGDSLPGTPTNRRAKYDAASFSLGREIRNRTKLQTH